MNFSRCSKILISSGDHVSRCFSRFSRFCEFPVEHVVGVTLRVTGLGSDRKCHRFNQPEKVGSGSSQIVFALLDRE